MNISTGRVFNDDLENLKLRRYRRGSIHVGQPPDATPEQKKKWFGRPPTPLAVKIWREPTTF